MGAHGSEGNGGCECEGLTMRGSVFLQVLDTAEAAHATRRRLVEALSFPPTLAFTKEVELKVPSMSAIAKHLPENIKLMTIASNYKAWNSGKLILRLSALGNDPLLLYFSTSTFRFCDSLATDCVGDRLHSQGAYVSSRRAPDAVSAGDIFSRGGLCQGPAQDHRRARDDADREPRTGPFEAKKLTWPTSKAISYENTDVVGAQTERVVLDESDTSLTVTIRAMEVKTYLVSFE